MKQTIRIFIYLCFLTYLPSVAQTGSYTPATVPSPKNAQEDGWIADPSHYLKQDDYETIEQLCNTLYKDVEVELAVVLLPNIDEARYDAFEFCQQLFNQWGIGGSGKNTGVLVFFSESTRDIRIHTGGGMEGLLPDAVCNEIIDEAIPTLSDGAYSKGILQIVKDIYSRLMTNDAKSELMLGWKPQPVYAVTPLDAYFYLAFLVLVLLSVWLYKRTNRYAKSTSLQVRPQAVSEAKRVQFIAGCLSFVFPLPVVFLYLYTRSLSKRLRTAPVKCDQCGGKMHQLTSENCQSLMTAVQLTEQRLQSREWDLWECEQCHHTESVAYEGKQSKQYATCSACGAVASMMIADHVLRVATQFRSGEGQKTYRCEHCGNKTVKNYIIPKLIAATAGGSSSGSHSSGGSFGGGVSFGGGAGGKF